MGISWEEKKTNDEILQKVGGRQLHGMLAKRKLPYFGQLMRKIEENLEKDIITGTIPGNKRRRPPHSWINNITDWMDMSMDKIVQTAWDREYWRDIVHRAAKVCNDE